MANTVRRFGGAADTRAAGNSSAISQPQVAGVGAVLAAGQYKMVGANPIVATKNQKIRRTPFAPQIARAALNAKRLQSRNRLIAGQNLVQMLGPFTRIK